MADDTVLMPDSLQDSPAPTGGESVEQPQATVEATASPTYSPEQGNQDEGDDKTAKRISDTDAALKAKQRELHEITVQLAAQKAVQEALQRERDGGKKDGAEESNPFGYLDDEDKDAEVDLQPGKGVRSILKDHTATMFKVLESRDSHLLGKVQAMLDEALNPERAELKDTIAELSQKPWFSALPKDQQLAAAKEWKSLRSAKTETIDPHKSSPGGTGRRVTTGAKTADEQREEAARAKARAIFGAQKEGDEDLYLMGKPTAKGK